MKGLSNKAIIRSAILLTAGAVLFQFQNCAAPGNNSTLSLGSAGKQGGLGGPTSSPTPTPTPPSTLVPDDAMADQFYVKASNNTIVVDSNNPAVNGPLVNNGSAYFAKVKFKNTGSNTWNINDYRVQVLDNATQWFSSGGLQLRCLDENNGNVPLAIAPGQTCKAMTVSPNNPGSLSPAFAGIDAGTCPAGMYTPKTVRFQMINTVTGNLFGPVISKEIFLCQN